MNVTITGGSRGIGAAAVRLFAARGDRVRFLYRERQDVATLLSAETGAEAVMCDVGDPAAVRAAFGADDTELLVCSAGVCHTGLISQISEEDFARLYSVNVGGVYRCVNAVLPAMLRRGGGAIVTVSSMWGEVGASCEAAYSATKGAVIALTKALAKELGPSHIRVNAVSPGLILTDMNRNLTADELETLRLDTPLERHGTPEDVARAIAYLADAEFVTGQILGVNGGFVI